MDVQPDYGDGTMSMWVRTGRGAVKRVDGDFHPPFYIHHGSREELRRLRRQLRGMDLVADARIVERRTGLASPEPRDVLEVTTASFADIKECASLVDGWGRYHRYGLFNVDIRLSQRYMLERGLFSLARLELPGWAVDDDDPYRLRYEIPPFREANLLVAVDDPFPNYDHPVSRIILDDLELEGPEEDMLRDLAGAVRRRDPDIILTEGGDEFVMAYLHHRAEVCGLGDGFMLGRENGGEGKDKRGENGGMKDGGVKRDEDGRREGIEKWGPRGGRSYFSYGQILYKPPARTLRGRIHIDRAASFMHREGGLPGLMDMARMSCIPLQNMSRLSPGTAISAMQVNTAMRDGCLVPWKKNLPEGFKTLDELVTADRGGLIFEPEVGLHENVLEVDFASLYPNIMARYNISPETILCPCCPDSGTVAPELGYHFCKRRRGLIPRVVKPIIHRRMAYKRMVRDEPENAHIYKQRADALKWVLVTCFGYTGYRNARFGRIECHESINAYGRDILSRAMRFAEAHDYRVLHGIVDSLWLKPEWAEREGGRCMEREGGRRTERERGRRMEREGGRRTEREGGRRMEREEKKGVGGGGGDDLARHQLFCDEVSRYIGIPLEVEGVYRWLVFLPNKTTGTGALNRYYGLFRDGELKLRGIELRKHDTPALLRRAQTEMLEVFSQASDARGFRAKIPEALEVLGRYRDMLMAGECDPKDLVLTRRVSKELEEYTQFNDGRAALEQLHRYGQRVNPGQRIRYVILDSTARDPMKRVRVAQLLGVEDPGGAGEGGEEGEEEGEDGMPGGPCHEWGGGGARFRLEPADTVDKTAARHEGAGGGAPGYDARKYTELLLRSGETLLSPFGYTEEKLKEMYM